MLSWLWFYFFGAEADGTLAALPRIDVSQLEFVDGPMELELTDGPLYAEWMP